MAFSSETKLNLVIGDPIKQSLSPFLHNLFYEKLKIQEEFVFLASEIKSENLEEFIKAVKLFRVNALSITLPHKTTIIEYLDKVEKTAKIIGAVNTVVNYNQKLLGYNTDWLGVLVPLLIKYKPNFELSLDYKDYSNTKIPKFLKQKKSAVIGSGGASRAACFALLSSGSEVWIFNRTFSKAEQIKIDLDKHFPNQIQVFGLNEIEKVAECQIIFNSTDLGMGEKKDFSPIPKKFLNSNQILFDAVYKPTKTKFLKEGEESKASIICGFQMLLWQAVFQLQIQTNKQLNLKIIKQTEKALLKKG